ncbi:hypothetical protein GC096_08655 [Paenibacillus sp. LMG 31461]|uniref:Restriction endonuclease n=1 Tax=Paenibacillus plantarum TaxID=2654975 RepID=A0ABX1X6Q3_9BACL|nr:hypothetical protein [Paenibacillus plantarum]NOU64092.1 hypothetical protein [Paenibacillus plantarum]
MDLTTPLGDQIKKLYQLFKASHSYFKDESGANLHIEFIPNGFDVNSDEQANYLASICYHIKRGIWKKTVAALNKLVPGDELDVDVDKMISSYFLGSKYSDAEKRIEHFQKERNPFILEVLAYTMVYNIEYTPNMNLTLKAMNKVHLSAKIPGLDVAALACTPELDYYLIIGEAKNRETPSEGTKEAFDAFNRHCKGSTTADIRQEMSLLAESADLLDLNGNELCEKISKETIWKDRYIYRITLEHQSVRPHGGSQFKDYTNYLENVTEAERKQGEAFGTERLTKFYNKVSQIILDHIDNKGVDLSA